MLCGNNSDESPDDRHDEMARQKLLQVLGEVLFLRDRLACLEEEAERLKDDLGR